MAVLLYHADIAPVPGGFAGVDVFFVISGYLITAGLVADRRRGRWSLAAFYERRVRRILPALFGMTLFAGAGAAVLLPPDALAGFGRSLLAMALFAGNLFFCFQPEDTAGYFASTAEPPLLLHSWSLAVEEQFYILLPLGLALLRRQSERATRRWLAGIALASFGFSLWAVQAWPLGAFYLLPSRAWELLAGSLLALGIAPPLPSRALREAAAALGLGLILLAVVALTRATPFPGAAALLPCGGAWLVIYASAGGPTLASRLLSLPPLVGTGLISYSLYLWHWPITVFVKQLSMGRLTATPTAFIILASFVAGYLSYRFIERPFRGKGLLSRPHLFAAAASGGVLALLIGAVAVASAGLPRRFSARTLGLIAANEAREGDRPPGNCENWRTPVRRLADIATCPIGALAGPRILFWGDSHVGSLRPLVQRLSDEGALQGRGAVFAVAAGCPPVARLAPNQPGYHCQAFARFALERAKAPEIETVFIGFSAWWHGIAGALCVASDDACRQALSAHAAEELFIGDVRREVRALTAAGKQVVLSLPAPGYSRSIPRLMINEALLGAAYPALTEIGIAGALKRNDYAPLRNRLAALAAETGATLFDPAASLCGAGRCRYQRDGVSLYVDDNHVASSQIGMFHDALTAALRKAAPRQAAGFP